MAVNKRTLSYDEGGLLHWSGDKNKVRVDRLMDRLRTYVSSTRYLKEIYHTIKRARYPQVHSSTSSRGKRWKMSKTKTAIGQPKLRANQFIVIVIQF